MTPPYTAAARLRRAARAAINILAVAAAAVLAPARQSRADVQQDPAVVFVTASPTNRSAWTHEVRSGADRYAIVALTLGQVMVSLPAAASVSFGGRAMTFLGGISNTNQVRVELWGLIDPAVGLQPVEVQLNANGAIVAGSVSYTGVDPQNPTRQVMTAVGTGSLASLTVDSGPDEYLVDVYGSVEMIPVPAPGQTPNWIDRNGVSGACSGRPGATTATMAWQRGGGNSGWTLAAVALKARYGPTVDGGEPVDAGPAPGDSAAADTSGAGDGGTGPIDAGAPGVGDASSGPVDAGGNPAEGGSPATDGPPLSGGADAPSTTSDAARRRVEFRMGCGCTLGGPRAPGPAAAAGPVLVVALVVALVMLAPMIAGRAGRSNRRRQSQQPATRGAPGR